MCAPPPPTPLHPTFPVCVYCNTLDRHGASCRHIRHNHNAASDSSCVPPILIPLTPLQPQPTKPSPIAVFVLATTVISPVCPLPPPTTLLLPCSHLHPSPTGNCPAKLPLRCWRFSLPFSQRIAPGHMAGHNPHTHPLEMLYRLHQSKWPEEGGTALMTLQTNESVGSLMALPIN